MWTSPKTVVAGDLASIRVGSMSRTLCAWIDPNITPPVVSRLLKSVPVIVTAVPPVIIPVLGEIEVMVGAAKYVNRPYNAIAEVATGLTTLTSTFPAAPAGDTAVIRVELTIVKLVALLAPNLTAETLKKLVPVISTVVLPVVGPDVGSILATVGTS